jgi:hypothetical protein
MARTCGRMAASLSRHRAHRFPERLCADVRIGRSNPMGGRRCQRLGRPRRHGARRIQTVGRALRPTVPPFQRGVQRRRKPGRLIRRRTNRNRQLGRRRTGRSIVILLPRTVPRERRNPIWGAPSTDEAPNSANADRPIARILFGGGPYLYRDTKTAKHDHRIANCYTSGHFHHLRRKQQRRPSLDAVASLIESDTSRSPCPGLREP